MVQLVTPLSKDAQLDALRTPPHSVEAEQSVLGGLLLDNAAWDRVVDVVSEADFYRADHRLIYQHIAQLIEHNKPADALTVAESLGRSGKLNDAGGQAYIGTLALNTPSAANIRRYGEIVRERAIMRNLAAVGVAIADSAYNPQGKDAHLLIDEAEARVFQLAETGAKSKQGFQKIDPFLTETVERIDMLYSRENKSDVIGLPTGFVDLDRMTSGLQGGDLIVVAGRPSMGKTALAMNMAENAALDSKKAVAVFSMEMSGSQLAMRMIGSVGRVDQHLLRTGTFQEEDWPRLVDAVGKLNDAQIFIDDTAGLNVLEVRSRARRLHRQCGGLSLIVVDYLQLMSGTSHGGRDENRATEIAEISRSLKGIAKELKVPVIALSQLNRSVDARQDKRPMMSDLRESGAIEQDADVILFIYRDEVYNQDSPRKGIAEIIIAKQRNGPVGKVDLTFVGRFTRFENYAGGDRFGGYDYSDSAA
jgi:replicative DNA helicase